MVKDKIKKDKIIQAYPQVSILSEICIAGEDSKIAIGGFTFDGGVMLESPYEFVKEETKSLGGKELTYYSIVKSSNRMSKREKDIRKIKRDREKEDKKWEKKRKEELKEELKRLEKK